MIGNQIPGSECDSIRDTIHVTVSVTDDSPIALRCRTTSRASDQFRFSSTASSSTVACCDTECDKLAGSPSDAVTCCDK